MPRLMSILRILLRTYLQQTQHRRNRMGFKTDWSFLDKISMGAVGTEAVINQLTARSFFLCHGRSAASKVVYS